MWKVRRWHFIVSFRSKSLRFRVCMALFLVLSLLLLLKLPPRQLNRCADLGSQAAAKPRRTYTRFTPENQQPLPSTPSYMEIRLLSSHFSTELGNEIKDRSVSTWKKKDQGVGDIARFPSAMVLTLRQKRHSKYLCRYCSPSQVH